MASAAATSASKLGSASVAAWALSGWAFFIAENAILSENRTFLIGWLGGEDPYHWVYGACSTAAMGSIGYSYYHLRRLSSASGTGALLVLRHPALALAMGWTSLTMGLTLALQGLPRMQVPLSPTTLQVRCPFDFAPQRRDAAAGNGDDTAAALYGVERLTRHPGLWSLGLVGLGNAALQTSPPLRLWWTGPALVAWLGGAHTDARYRRGLGGVLEPQYDAVTSNLPLAAALSGRQGPVGPALRRCLEELKPLNAALAALLATGWVVVGRGRLRLR